MHDLDTLEDIPVRQGDESMDNLLLRGSVPLVPHYINAICSGQQKECPGLANSLAGSPSWLAGGVQCPGFSGSLPAAHMVCVSNDQTASSMTSPPPFGLPSGQARPRAPHVAASLQKALGR